MQRRKFLATVGSLTAASAAAIGTGAFNFANIERDANMRVAADGDAFLALNDTSEYAYEANNRLHLAFDENADVTGTGVNADSDYSFTGVFSISNQGSQSVGIWIEDNDPKEIVSWYGTSSDDTADFSTSIEGSGNAYKLGVGETVYVNVVILLRGPDAYMDLPDMVNIKADASQG